MVTKTSESFELCMHSIGQGNVILEYVISDEKAVLAEWHKIEVCKLTKLIPVGTTRTMSV